MNIIITLFWLLLAMPATGSCTVTPGKTLGANELVDNAKLNQGFNPVVKVGNNQIGKDQLVEDDVIELAGRLGLPNILINGNFDIWQRGGWPNLIGLPTSFGATADIAISADRWMIGEAPGVNYRQVYRETFETGQSQVPREPQYFLRYKQLIAQTDPRLSYSIEDVRTMAGQTVTVSGWLRSDIGCTIKVGFRQWYGGSPSPGIDIAQQDVVLTAGTQWVKFELTFEIPALAYGGMAAGADSALTLRFTMPDAVIFQLDYAQIKVEQSGKATAFMPRSLLDEGLAAERYFEYSEGVLASDITTHQPCYYFTTRKYRAPTLTLLAGYAGTGATLVPLNGVGYKQTTAHSVVAAFFVAADAEIDRN